MSSSSCKSSTRRRSTMLQRELQRPGLVAIAVPIATAHACASGSTDGHDSSTRRPRPPDPIASVVAAPISGRAIVLLASLPAVLLVLAAWALIWQPLTRDTRARAAPREQRAALATARRRRTKSPRSREAPVAPSSRDARSDVESALARTVSRPPPSTAATTSACGSRSTRFRSTRSACLLDTLQRDARLNAVELTAAARVEPGQVRAEMTLSPPR